MAIDINIPSQVKNYANLAGFPVTGSLKTIFIAEDTNKTYRWTGSAYVEISAGQAASWGTITGTLSTQTDLQTALNAKQNALGFTPVPTSRTLTINGTTQDLSADRTFTISTGITIGTTAITSGVVGRVLFEGTGNVVSESANLFWDNTNGRLGIGTATPAYGIDVVKNQNGATEVNIANITGGTLASTSLRITSSSGTAVLGRYSSSTTAYKTISANDSFFYTAGTSDMSFLNDFATGKIKWATGGVSTVQMTLFSTGNLGLNTTTDAGFRLDVNGTARVQGELSLGLTGTAGRVNLARSSNGTMIGAIYTSNNDLIIENASQGIFFNSIGAERMRIAPTTGNILINTTTDAGFKLDVNGTARFGNVNQSTNANSITAGYEGGFLLSGGVAALKRDTTGYLKTLLDCGYDGGLRIRPYSSGFTSYVDVRSDTSAALTVTSTNQGFLPPRLTTTQKNAIATPATGLMVYDNTLNRPCFYDGTTWITL